MLLHDPFDFHARSRGDNCFAQCEGAQITYAEAKRRSDRIAAALAEVGLTKGDRVCVLMRNAIDVLLLIYAASRLGVVPVPLNYRLAPREWGDIILDCGAAAIVADADYVLGLEAGLAALTPGPALIRICTSGGHDGWAPLDSLIADAPPYPPRVALSPDDTLFQIYTSGTTGKAKGALLTQQSILSNIFQSTLASPYRLNPGERSLVALPLFHIAALSTALGAASCGGCLVIHRDIDPMAIARALAEDEIVAATLVPAVLQFLLAVPGLADMSFPHLNLLGYGASPIAEPVLRRALEVFDCRIAQGYGMTELAGSCCLLTESDHLEALSGRPELLLSAGNALPGCEVRVVDPDDNDLPPGVTGEVIVRGDQVMSGYWNMPDATAEALKGGWMHTGDAGFLDEEGYLFIRDRIKDMIVSGAENVYPAEVESVLYQHAAVAEVAVIGVPDPRWGETVMAVVVNKPGQAVSEAELDAFCRDRLGAFKVPRRYAFVLVLPRNATGKVLKRDLREEYWAGHSRRVS